MKRIGIPLLLLVCVLGLAFVVGKPLPPANEAKAQAPRLPQKWEYAALVAGDTAADLHWQAGKTTLSTPGDVKKPDITLAINQLYRELGGKEESATLGMLLNLLGRDGWEMVSYARPPGVQTWMFKRAIP